MLININKADFKKLIPYSPFPIFHYLLASMISLLSVSQINCQSNKTTYFHRKAKFAGTFYPADSLKLSVYIHNTISGYRATIKQDSILQALIVPHAGYTYCGKILAAAYASIDTSLKYSNIFILAPSHHYYTREVSLFASKAYETPLGLSIVNSDIIHLLINKYTRLFTYDSLAHQKEHAIEVQLPFLQSVFNNKIKIVPILFETQDPKTIQRVATILQPYFTPKNLFIISSDFSHYPPKSLAKYTDSISFGIIKTRNKNELIKREHKIQRQSTNNLRTTMCGFSAVLCLLDLITNQKIELLKYQNSGDLPQADTSRVVGYLAIKIINPKKMEKFTLSEKEKSYLLTLARKTITNFIEKNEATQVDTSELTPNLKVKTGAFVTLNEKERLRGCIGSFYANKPLYRIVQEMAISAATQDTRFSPVQAQEIPDLHIEISVLTPLHKISSIDEIQLGKHGIYIKKGYHTGTLLPQVATENNWTKEEFLSYCSKNKAGLKSDSWRKKEVEIFVYEALVFSEK